MTKTVEFISAVPVRVSLSDEGVRVSDLRYAPTLSGEPEPLVMPTTCLQNGLIHRIEPDKRTCHCGALVRPL